jgi:hypothetical protein
VHGRQTSDTITTLGSGVNGTVQRIDTVDNSQGLPYLYTSYADTAGMTVVNQVEAEEVGGKSGTSPNSF